MTNPAHLASAVVAAAVEVAAHPAIGRLRKGAQPREALRRVAAIKGGRAARAADLNKAIGLSKGAGRRKAVVGLPAAIKGAVSRAARVKVAKVAAGKVEESRAAAAKARVAKVEVGRAAPVVRETVPPATARSRACRQIPMTIFTAARPMPGSIRPTNSMTTTCIPKTFTPKMPTMISTTISMTI